MIPSSASEVVWGHTGVIGPLGVECQVAFGYRISRAKLTLERQLDPEINFDNPQLGPGGAAQLLGTVMREVLAASGDRDQTNSSYIRFDSVALGGWVVAVDTSGGTYDGRNREVVDSGTHTRKSEIGAGDVVLDPSKVLLVVPPFGTSALLIALVDGRSHATAGFMRVVNRQLARRGLKLRLEHNFTDATAWGQFMSQANVDVTGLELVQRHAPDDGTSFVSPDIKKATVSIVLSENAEAKRGILRALLRRRDGGAPPNLTGLVGLRLVDDDFSERRVVYVQDGRERRMTVDAQLPIFTYALDVSDEPPSLQYLLESCFEDAAFLLAELGVDVTDDWWTPIHEMDVTTRTTDEVPGGDTAASDEA